MTKKHFLTPYLAPAGILLISSFIVLQNANATGFLPQEARGMAMGGAGVAVGNSRQAHYYNPSLLVNAPEEEDFNFEVDLAVRLSDSDKLIQSVKDFADDDPISALGTSITDLNTAVDNINPLNTPAQIKTSLTPSLQGVVDSSTGIQTGIQNVTGKSFSLDANLGTFASVPNLDISTGVGFAVYVNGWANVGIQGKLAEQDNTSMDTFINSGQTIIDSNDPTTILAQINTLVNNDPTANLQSSVSIQGGAVVEIGIAMAKKQTINNYDLDIGITPKIQKVTTFGIEKTLAELEAGIDLADQEDPETTTSFNFDIGISKELDDHWTTGLIIKNLIPYTYDVKNVDKDVEIAPSARIGAAWKNNWISAGADLDLTKNEDIASLSETQFLSLGAELDVWILQLRGGYRQNLAGGGGSGPSVGFGLYLLGLNIDAAVASNSIDPGGLSDADNINASAQLGFNW